MRLFTTLLGGVNVKTIQSIFKIYKIEKALVKMEDKIEIVILNRNSNMSFNKWVNFISSIKGYYNKDVEFILLDDAKKIYDNLDEFTLMEVGNDG